MESGIVDSTVKMSSLVMATSALALTTSLLLAPSTEPVVRPESETLNPQKSVLGDMSSTQDNEDFQPERTEFISIKNGDDESSEQVADGINLEVTHIKFNHTAPQSVGDSLIENTSDGLQILKAFGVEFSHEDHDGDGEWIKVPRRNEPALYVANVTPTIKVRLAVPLVHNQKVLTVFALSKNLTRLIPTQLGPFNILIPVINNLDIPNVKPRSVRFDKRGISIGDDQSEYVEFSLSGPMRETIAKTAISFKWHFSLIDEAADPIFFEKTGPHTVYTVHDRPQAPWNNNNLSQKPWVSALDFAIEKARTQFRRNVHDIAQRVTLFVYREYDFKYDAKKGLSRFLIPNRAGKKILGLTNVIKNAKKIVNCDDVALVLSALTSLLGLRADYTDISNFGYLKRSSLVGFKQEINSALDIDPGINGNRSGLDTGVHPELVDPILGRIKADDNIFKDPSPNKRFPFIRHAISRIGSVQVGFFLYDACLGTKDLLPHLKVDGEQEYLDRTRDISTGREINSENNIDDDGNPVPYGKKDNFHSKSYEIK